MNVPPGTNFGPYRILEKIGAGGMGEVYRAVDSRLNREVAIKLVSDEYLAEAFGSGSPTPGHASGKSGSPGTVSHRRFLREAQASGALNHPSICTIHDIGEQDGRPYLVMELLRGETLKSLLHEAPLSVTDIVTFSRQIASALTVAHAHGIVHRDIKPANLFVVSTGGKQQIKILDFGLAKQHNVADVTDSSAETSEGTMDLELTSPGAMLGTVAYMSPEQSQGEPLDSRTDLFSLGSVMYEMAAGKSPFAGASAAATFAALLTKEPEPISVVRAAAYLPAMPDGFDPVVAGLLAKDKTLRYQSAAEVERDLEQLDVATHSHPSHSGAGRAIGLAGTRTGRSMRSKAALLTGAIVVIVGIALAVGLHYLHTTGGTAKSVAPTATATGPKQSIILTDFVNQTGDPVFDTTLRQALQIDLEQSPVIDVVSAQHVRQSVKYLGKPADTPITPEIAREIGEREGDKAVLTETIASLGKQYVVTLGALNTATGDEFAIEQAQAPDKEHVLDALGHAATAMRAKLGEDLASIHKLDTSFEDATTGSLEAFRAYALGHAAAEKGLNVPDAEGYYKRAIELDPKFAVAYAGLAAVYSATNQAGKSNEYYRRAFDLSRNVSERERLYIASLYYEQIIGDLPNAVETLQEASNTYPNSHGSIINLGVAYQILAQFEKGLPYAEKSTQMAPENAIASVDLLTDLIALDKLDDAKQEMAREDRLKLNSSSVIAVEQMLAYFLMGDQQKVSRIMAAHPGGPGAYVFPLNLMATQQFSGQNHLAAQNAQAVLEMAGRDKAPDVQAIALLNRAIGDGLAGVCANNDATVKQALSLDKSKSTLEGAAVTSAICGNGKIGLPIAEDLAKKYPEDTLVNDVYLPLTRAFTALAVGNAQQAVEDAVPAVPFSEVYPGAYVQGLAYLKLHDANQAMRAFQTASRYRGSSLIGFGPFYAQAQLGLARAYAMAGDSAGAKKEYQAFFATWKNADADLPLLVAAKKEYAAL
jgi:serine/threonine protein kinase/tetratricopeptide (TPR) repeat protein